MNAISLNSRFLFKFLSFLELSLCLLKLLIKISYRSLILIEKSRNLLLRLAISFSPSHILQPRRLIIILQLHDLALVINHLLLELRNQFLILLRPLLRLLLSLESLRPHLLLKILDHLVTVLLQTPPGLRFGIPLLPKLIIVLLGINEHLLKMVHLGVELLHFGVVYYWSHANRLILVLDHAVKVSKCRLSSCGNF